MSKSKKKCQSETGCDYIPGVKFQPSGYCGKHQNEARRVGATQAKTLVSQADVIAAALMDDDGAGIATPDNPDWENDDGTLNHDAIANEFDDTRDPNRCEDCGLHRTTHPNMGCVGNYPDPKKERYMQRKAVEALYDSPLGNSVDRLQDEGRNVYIAGFTKDHKYALVVDGDGDQVAVASLHTVNGIGRWECSKTHYENEIGLYSERFPVR